MDEFEETEPELELLEWAGMVSIILREGIGVELPHPLTNYPTI